MPIKSESAAPMPVPVHVFTIDGVQYSVRPYISGLTGIRLKVYRWEPGRFYGGKWHEAHHDSHVWNIGEYTRQTKEMRAIHAGRAVESAVAFARSIADLETYDLHP